MDEDGNRSVVFEINGNRRVVQIKDKDAELLINKEVEMFADTDDILQIGANLSGCIISILAQEGEIVTEGQPIAVIEAMKMETNILSTTDGIVKEIYVKEGNQVTAGQLIARLK